MQAYLEQSFEFQGLDEKAQDIVKQIVGQFDSEFYAQFDNETEMASWVTENIVNKFKGKDGENPTSLPYKFYHTADNLSIKYHYFTNFISSSIS